MAGLPDYQAENHDHGIGMDNYAQRPQDDPRGIEANAALDADSGNLPDTNRGNLQDIGRGNFQDSVYGIQSDIGDPGDISENMALLT